MPETTQTLTPKRRASSRPGNRKSNSTKSPNEPAVVVPRPIVKWAGGKGRLLGELLPRVPNQIGRYYEPFFGGGALFISLAAMTPPVVRRATLTDQNPELIACYRALRDDVDGLIQALSNYRYDEEFYYQVRARDMRGASDVERGARLIYLNRTCYNGLWRVNAAGTFNVPFGRYANPTICNEPLLRKVAPLLKHATIRVADFAASTCRAREGDFVYFDPPYLPVSKTANFATYAAGGFNAADHERLRSEFARLASAGVYAMLSNADTPASRELYKDFSCFSIGVARRINSNIRARGDAAELIVTNWGRPGVWDGSQIEWTPKFIAPQL
jgi:DNA adenine methylase